MSFAFFMEVLPEGDASATEGFLETIRPATPAVIPLDDAAVVRGDGVFETLGVMNRRVHARDTHLARLAHSARLLDLPAPNLAQWSAALDVAASVLPPAGPGMIRISLSRGTAATGPRAWLIAEASTVDVAARRDGIAVVILDRGLSVDAAEHTPWLLAGAKTLSYAVNMAALREAKRRGAEDVIFRSQEGFALEGPTSSLLVRVDGRFISPPPSEAILDGTTVAAAFEWLRAHGWRCDYERIPVSELARVDAAWLLSSLRLAAPIRVLDGRNMPAAAALTEALNDALEERTH